MRRAFLLSAAFVVTAVTPWGPAGAAPGSRPGSQQPARDTPARARPRRRRAAGSAAACSTADNGRPVKRARVFVNAAELPGGRGMLTDDNGVFEITELPAGRYTLTCRRSGFVSLSYGQRRPLQAGTPLQLADGQQLKGIDFRLPRGSVIAGRVLDEDGEPVPGATVRVMRYQYRRANASSRRPGRRRPTTAGSTACGA